MNQLAIRDKLLHLGFIVKSIKSNGKIQRCGTASKPNKQNGWYIINDDCVIYGDWSSQIENGYFWLDDAPQNKTKFDFEKLRLHQKITELKEMQEKKLLIKTKFSKFTEIPQSHWYLTKKQALIQDDFKLDWQRNLIIPLYDIAGCLTGYQRITQDGKMFGGGSQPKFSLYPLYPHQSADLIILAEGYATASSIFLALNEEWDAKSYTVICCFCSSNVDRVASLFPGKYVVAIKDNDPAGRAVKTRGFTVGVEGQDANDVHVEKGLNKLTKQLMKGFKTL